MHQTGDISSGGVGARPAPWGSPRSRSRAARAVIGVVTLALMGVTRSVPAQTTQVARRACAIQVSGARATSGDAVTAMLCAVPLAPLPMRVVRAKHKLAPSPCPNWQRGAALGMPNEPVSLQSPSNSTVHEAAYLVTLDSALPDRGCFADSLAIAVGARLSYSFKNWPAFTFTRLSAIGLERVRRTPHVAEVVKAGRGFLGSASVKPVHGTGSDLRHVDTIASGTVSVASHSHIDAWGAGIGAVAVGLAGYAYERGSCDVVASRCTGRHGAIVGAVIGAFLGYTIGQVLTRPGTREQAATSGCLPDGTPDAARLLAVARLMVTADTGVVASARSMYHFPHMSAEDARTQVAVVRAPEVCTRVAAAFRRVVRDSVSTGPLYVIAVGDMFWVYDPASETAASEFQPYVSFYPDLRVAGIGAT